MHISLFSSKKSWGTEQQRAGFQVSSSRVCLWEWLQAPPSPFPVSGGLASSAREEEVSRLLLTCWMARREHLWLLQAWAPRADVKSRSGCLAWAPRALSQAGGGGKGRGEMGTGSRVLREGVYPGSGAEDQQGEETRTSHSHRSAARCRSEGTRTFLSILSFLLPSLLLVLFVLQSVLLARNWPRAEAGARAGVSPAWNSLLPAAIQQAPCHRALGLDVPCSGGPSTLHL